MRTMLLNDMLNQLRREARVSTNVSHGGHLLDTQISLLARVQEEVYDGFDWPSLRTHRTVTLSAGQRYAEYPTDFDYATIRRAYAHQPDVSDRYVELTYGIGVDQMNCHNSDAGETSSRICRFDNYLSPAAEFPNSNMFEVWPLSDYPATIRFDGQLKLQPLTELLTHRSTVDGLVVVLHAAAEMLAAQKAEDAGLKLQKAQQRYDALKQRESATDNRRIIRSAGAHTGHQINRNLRWQE